MLVLVLVPLVAIVPLAGVRVVSGVSSIRSESDVHDQAIIAEHVVGLVNALGDERDLTEVALNGRGFKGNKDLKQAQRASDEEVGALGRAVDKYHGSISALPTATQQLGDQAQARLGDLNTLRDSAARLGSGTPAFTTYSTIIDNLLDFSTDLATSTQDHRLDTLVTTVAAVEQTEEQSSQQRGYLVDVLGGGHASLEQTEDLEQTQAKYTSAYDSVTNNAPTSIVNLFQSTVSGDKVGAADGTLQTVTAAAQEGTSINSVGVSRSTAFNQMTAKVNAIRSVEHTATDKMVQRSNDLLSDARTTLYENIGIIVVVIVLSFLGAMVLARSVVRTLSKLRRSALDVADSRLPEVVRRLRDTNASTGEVHVDPIEVDTKDEVGQVARAFDRVHFEAVRLATEQAVMRSNVNAMFTNLSRRSESLVLRQLSLIDELENGEQNPTQLSSLFKLDHLATRMRRNNENLLVLAGEEQGRRWNRPVLLLDIARAAAAEVEEYERVALREVPDVAVVGRAATDVVHLTAELIENATTFSAPETEVTVSAKSLDTGEVMLDISDAGIGMEQGELHELNERLARPPVADVAVSRRMGLFVVGRLAAKYGIQVRLRRVVTGGTSAIVVLPLSLLKPSSDLDSDASAAFDQSRRPGHETPDISDLLNPGFASQADDDRTFHSLMRGEDAPSFPPSPGPEPSGPSFPARDHDVPPREMPSRNGELPRREPPSSYDAPAEPAADEFSWFTDEADADPGPPPPGLDDFGATPQGPGLQGPQGPGREDFTWFDEQVGGAPPSPSGQEPSRGIPAFPDRPALDQRPSADLPVPFDLSGPPAQRGGIPSQPRGGEGPPERLPIYESIRSKWFGPEGPADGHGRAEPEQQARPGSYEENWENARTHDEAQGDDATTGTRSGAGRSEAGGPEGTRPYQGGDQRRDRAGEDQRPRDVVDQEQRQRDRAQQERPAERTARLRLSPEEQQRMAEGHGGRSDQRPPEPARGTAADAGGTEEVPWSSVGDDGWRAAAAASKPVTAGLTERGLPKRVPRGNLVPGSAASPEAPTPGPAKAPPRDAQQLQQRLSRFHQGVRRGKDSAGRGDGRLPNESDQR